MILSNVRNSNNIPCNFGGTQPQNVIIPNVDSEDLNGNKRVKDIFSTLNDHRIIICDGEVNDMMASIVTAQLIHLKYLDEKAPIYMYINSPGGSITAGLSIFDTMLNITCPVHTIGTGMCASMGAFLLAAGNVCGGTAQALPNCEIMIHQPLYGYQGQVTDMDIHTQRVKEIKETMTSYLAYFCNSNEGSIVSKLNSTEEKIQFLLNNCERDNFLSAEKAKEFGLISSVLYSAKHTDMHNKMKELGFTK